MELWAAAKVSYAHFKNQIDIVTWFLRVGGNAGRRSGVGRKGKEGRARGKEGGEEGEGREGKKGGERGGGEERGRERAPLLSPASETLVKVAKGSLNVTYA